MNKRQNIRRESFDEVADLYDMARPGYPLSLVDDLVELTGLHSGTRVLEIGCGTGQLTLPLAEHGASLNQIGRFVLQVEFRGLQKLRGVWDRLEHGKGRLTTLRKTASWSATGGRIWFDGLDWLSRRWL